MAPISQKSRNVSQREVAVESAHGFGDCLFNAPLIQAISKHHNCKVAVAVRPHCRDGYSNLPWISEIVTINNVWEGIATLKRMGFKTVHQITQNIRFFEFLEHNHNHSLIDTPLLTGIKLGIPDFDQKPIILPTETESNAHYRLSNDYKYIAVESIFTSGQSWANPDSFAHIINKYGSTHKILWLSNHGAPVHPNVVDCLKFTRRELIFCLHKCEVFFSVGSGFFCGAMALPPELQPKKIVCLWIDDMYKYKHRIAELGWHNNITWISNNAELTKLLAEM